MIDFLKYGSLQFCLDVVIGVFGALVIGWILGVVSDGHVFRFMKFSFGIVVMGIVFRNLFLHYFVSWMVLKKLSLMFENQFLVAFLNLAFFCLVYLFFSLIFGWNSSFFRGFRAPTVMIPTLMSVYVGSLVYVYFKSKRMNRCISE